MDYKYKISVVMAVYNVEEYLKEAIDSIINQDIGFENIQIVLVDDGSVDLSGEICDDYSKKYPDNIKVLHKINEGLAKARVDGIRLSEGKYISFFDPDDTLSINSFKNIVDFFENNYDEIDVVSMPLYYFGDKTGEHPLNYKFKKGTRIIDLFKEPTCIQLSFASSLIKSEVAHLVGADSEIVTAEDAKEIIKILLIKNRLGVVSTARYNYRRRNLSSVTGASAKKGWYTTYLNNFSLYALKYAKDKLYFTPKYIQHMVMYDLQWRFSLKEFPNNVLDVNEKEEFLKLLFDVISLIDDDVIMKQKHLSPEHKFYILNKKYGSISNLCCFSKNVRFSFILLDIYAFTY